MRPGKGVQRKDKKKRMRVRHFRREMNRSKAIWMEVRMRERTG